MAHDRFRVVTGFLLDTDVVSSVSPISQPPLPVAAWMRERSDFLWLSAVTVAEITSGIAKLKRQDARRKHQQLAAWLDRLLDTFGDRILALDLQAGRMTGELLDRARAGGHEPGFADIAIAGIAQAHGLVVATRNMKQFRPLGIVVINPFEHPGPSA